jgi:hypothetical protein
LSVDAATPEVLSSDELGAILRHQLETPVSHDLEDPAGAPDAGGSTFGELLAATRPPLEVLVRVKSFAKSCKANPNGPLPAEVATALYYAFIAKALVAHDARTTALSDAVLANGMRWTLRQPWIPEPMRALLERALSAR